MDPIAACLARQLAVRRDQEIAETHAQLALAEEAARVELAQLDADAARLSLYDFFRQGWHVLEPMPLEDHWIIEALCANAQAMLEEWLRTRDDRRLKMRWQNLAMNVCPSTLKSRVVMVFAVAWMWLRCASWSVLCVSANPANVTRDAEACRDLVTSKWYRETFKVTWSIRDDVDSKAKFATTAGGVRYSRGLISKFTGIHVDAIFADDLDDADEVHSEAERKKRVGKWKAIGNRVNDQRCCIRICIQQRVHVDDHTGDLLSRGGYLHASYPLEYRDEWRRDSPFYRDPRSIVGEILNEVRFTPEVIAAERLRLGSLGFEAQYNQNPAPTEGNMFKRAWWKFFRVAGVPVGSFKRPQGCRADEAKEIDLNDLDFLTISVDASFGSVSDTASAVGLIVLGGIGPDRFVFRDRTKRRTFPQTKDAIKETEAEWPCTPSRLVIKKLIENKANGAAVIQDLETTLQALVAFSPNEYGSKGSRANAMSPAVEGGNWYLLEGGDWDEYVGELGVFPGGKADDRVDATSQAAIHHHISVDAADLQKRIDAMQKMRGAIIGVPYAFLR